MIGDTARQRTARRARFLAIVLVAGAGAALLGGAPARAAATCSWNTTTQEVTIDITSTGDETITIKRTAGSPGTLTVDGATGTCNGAPLDEIGTITVTATADAVAGHDQTVVIDQTNGPFEPGNSLETANSQPEIEFAVSLDDGDDTVSILGKATGDDIVAGAAGLNLNAGEAVGPDADVSLTSVEILLIDGKAGNDTISGAGGANTGAATALPLTVIGGDGNDTLTGGAGTSTVSYAGASAAVTVDLSVTTAQNTGGAGTDTLTGFQNLTGSGNNDVLRGNAGDNVLDGGTGTGNDTASYANAPSGVTVDLDIATAQTTGAGDDTLTNIDNLTGSAFADELTGDENANVIDGGAGNDELTGGGATDTVSYAAASAAVTVDLGIVAPTGQNTQGAGTDTLAGFENVTGSAFGDTLSGDSGNNVVKAGTGDDNLKGGTGDDTLDGEGGTDTADYSGNTAVTVDLSNTSAQTTGVGSDTLTSLENVLGSSQNDTLSGTTGANRIDGGGHVSGGDTVSYNPTAGVTGGVTVDLAIAVAQDTVGSGMDTLVNLENVTGSGQADMLSGDAGANTLSGGAAVDTLDGRAGIDTLNGGDGDDTLVGGTEADTLNGDADHDTLRGGAGGDGLTGGAGSDTADYSTAGAAVLANLATPAGNTGEADDDTYTTVENLRGTSFDDSLTGDAAANVLDGRDGSDSVSGSAGNDTLIGGGGDDQLSGQGDFDTADYSTSPASVTVSLAVTTAQATGGAGNDTLNGLENLTGSAFDDRLTGRNDDNIVSGGAGNDTLAGGAGNDTLNGDAGTGDTVDYSAAPGPVTVNLATNTGNGEGIDQINNIENVVGSPDHDTLRGDSNANVLEGGLGNDTIEGSGGSDTVSYSTAPAGVTVDLGKTAPTSQNTVGAGTDTLLSIENATGSAFVDSLTGDGSDNVLNGLAGNDNLIGKDGNDTLAGGEGTADKVDYSGTTAVTVDLGGPAPQATGAAGVGNDTISAVENVTGSTANDTIGGNASDNVLDGGDGTDTLSYASATAGVTVNLKATAAQDTVGAGTDTVSNFENLTGSASADTLLGNDGNNVITGGGGLDTVSYANAGVGVTVSLRTTAAQTTGAGDDTITQIENLTGSPQADTLAGDGGDNAIDGGNDLDTVTFAASTGEIELDLEAGTAKGDGEDELSNIEKVIGSPQGDTLNGSGVADTLTGGDGDDTINGRGGNDTEAGGNGNDTFYQDEAPNGADDMSGGAGSDTVEYHDRETIAFVTFDNQANDGEAGEGDNARSDIEKAELATFVPTAPTNVQATAGDGLATVTWVAPANDGNSPITGYDVLSLPGNKKASTGPEARSATVAGLTNGTTYTFTVTATNSSGTGTESAPSNPVTPATPPKPVDPTVGQGYAMLGNDGGVFNYGAAGNFGSIPGLGLKLNQPPIGMSYTPTGKGYWIVAQDGGIFSFGDAKFHGSMGNVQLNAPVLGMEPTPTGAGYWLFASDGGIFSFGDAKFFGSMGASKLNAPVIGMAATSTGKGYWLVAQDGGIFSFGDAKFRGSMGNAKLNQPVFDMAPAADDAGYYLVARDGGIFAFGSAAGKFFGSAAPANPATVIGIGTTPSGNGYWIADRNGVVYAFGDAKALGDLRGLGRTVVGLAALPKQK
ncbi:MAG: fibronectin type III domain-containing protein [Actinomycetota bacterium]|nr:fibronectin type III domain-containing protein [Actinomycetota bacterium]